MKLVKHLLDAKNRDLISINPDASVLDAIKLMASESIGSVLVMQDGELVGIVTERDYARKVIVKGRSSSSTNVDEIMSTNIISVSPDKSVNACMTTMTDEKIRHLPVIDESKVVGIISIGDLVQAIIEDQQDEIHQLEQYISG